MSRFERWNGWVVCVCMYVVGGGDFSEPSECDCGSCEGCWVTGAIYAERRLFSSEWRAGNGAVDGCGWLLC